MSDEDPIEGGAAIAMTAAAAGSRVAEVLIRQAQETMRRRTSEHRDYAAELRQQLSARAEVAAAYFAETSAPAWLKEARVDEIKAAVQAVHIWAEADPDRFAPAADKMREQLKAAFGLDLREVYVESMNADAVAEFAAAGVASARDQAPQHQVVGELGTGVKERGVDAAYDDPEHRAERHKSLEENPGVPAPATTARVVSDQLNAQDPRGTAAAAAASKTSSSKAARRSRVRHPGQERGR